MSAQSRAELNAVYEAVIKDVLDKVRADLESTGMDSHAVGDTMDDLESKWRAKLRAASEAGLQRAANRQSTSTTTLIPKPSVAAQSTAPVAQSAPAQTASALPSLGVPAPTVTAQPTVSVNPYENSSVSAAPTSVAAAPSPSISAQQQQQRDELSAKLLTVRNSLSQLRAQRPPPASQALDITVAQQQMGQLNQLWVQLKSKANAGVQHIRNGVLSAPESEREAAERSATAKQDFIQEILGLQRQLFEAQSQLIQFRASIRGAALSLPQFDGPSGDPPKKKTKFGSSSMLQSLPTAGTKPPAGSGVAKPLASSASTFVESAAVGSKRKASEPSSSVAAVAAPTYSSTTWGSAGATEAEAEADPIAEVLEDFDFDDLDVDEYLIGADEEEQVYGDGNQILALYESVSHDNKSKNAKKDADESQGRIWRFILRLGIMHIDGVDFVFNTASGTLSEMEF